MIQCLTPTPESWNDTDPVPVQRHPRNPQKNCDLRPGEEEGLHLMNANVEAWAASSSNGRRASNGMRRPNLALTGTRATVARFSSALKSCLAFLPGTEGQLYVLA